MSKNIFIVLLCSNYILLMILFARMYLADVFYESSQNSFANQDYERAAQKSTQAASLNPNEPAYLRHRAKALIMMSFSQNKAVFKSQAYDDLISAYHLNPDNLATIRNSVPLLYFLSVKDYTIPATFGTNIDTNFFNLTKDYFANVKNISQKDGYASFARGGLQNDVGIFVLLAKYEKKLGLTNEYEDSIKKITDLRPDLLEWHPDLK